MQVTKSLQPTAEHRKFCGSLGDLSMFFQLTISQCMKHFESAITYQEGTGVVEISLFLFVGATMTEVALNRPVKFNYRII